MFQKIAKHRANDASNDVHRPPLIGRPPPIIRAMPERKRFFSMDLFPKDKSEVVI